MQSRTGLATELVNRCSARRVSVGDEVARDDYVHRAVRINDASRPSHDATTLPYPRSRRIAASDAVTARMPQTHVACVCLIRTERI